LSVTFIQFMGSFFGTLTDHCMFWVRLLLDCQWAYLQ